MPMKVRYETVYGEVLSETRGGVYKQYIPDPLGNTVALMDDTQTITDTFSYWPYGETASRTGTTATLLQYGGTRGYYADSTGSNLPTYVRARYLDSGSGRWMTTDPIGYRAGDVNVYRYAGNSPVAYNDPTGLITPACIAAAACIGGAGIASIIACATSPKGFAGCMACFCAKNPVVCAAVAATCSVLVLACLPELAPIILKIINLLPQFGPVGQPVPAAFGDGSDGGGSSPCSEEDWKRCKNIFSDCVDHCQSNFCGIRWLKCCHATCDSNLLLCGQGSPPIPWPCGKNPFLWS